MKAIQVAKTASPLVQQCQKALNDISTQLTVSMYWVSGHAGLRGTENHGQGRKGRLYSEVNRT